MTHRPDLFISYASEDRASFVAPLAARLERLAVRVWYDQFSLAPGDRLSEKIGEGLAQTRCGLVVLSHSFLGKAWTKYELSGLVNRFVEEQMRLVPIWLGVSRSDVARLNPALADLVAIQGTSTDIHSIAKKILKIVRPQLYQNLEILDHLKHSEVSIESVPLKNLKLGPIRHHDLPAPLLVRIQNVFHFVRDVYPTTLSETIENFQRDLNPDHEVEVWERMVSATYKTLDMLAVRDLETKRHAFNIVLALVMGLGDSIVTRVEAGEWPIETVDAAIVSLRTVVPPVAVSDVDQA